MMSRRFLVVLGAAMALGLMGGAIWQMSTSEVCAQAQQWGEDMLGIVRDGKF